LYIPSLASLMKLSRWAGVSSNKRTVISPNVVLITSFAIVNYQLDQPVIEHAEIFAIGYDDMI